MASFTDHGFLGRGFESLDPPIIHYYDYPHVELEKRSSGYPRKGTAWILTRPPVIRPTSYPAGPGWESVIRLSLGRKRVSL